MRINAALAAPWRNAFVFAIWKCSVSGRLALVSKMFGGMRTGDWQLLSIDRTFIFSGVFDRLLSLCIIVQFGNPLLAKTEFVGRAIVPSESRELFSPRRGVAQRRSISLAQTTSSSWRKRASSSLR
jgi:hypothetical protein